MVERQGLEQEQEVYVWAATESTVKIAENVIVLSRFVWDLRPRLQNFWLPLVQPVCGLIVRATFRQQSDSFSACLTTRIHCSLWTFATVPPERDPLLCANSLPSFLNSGEHLNCTHYCMRRRKRAVTSTKSCLARDQTLISSEGDRNT